MAEEKNSAAVDLGRHGGLKSGKAYASKTTPEERSESAAKQQRRVVKSEAILGACSR